MANPRTAPAPQRQASRPGASRPGINARPGTPFKAGWGARIWMLVLLVAVGATFYYLGVWDDDSEVPEEVGYIVPGVCLALFALYFAVQARVKFVLYGDRLEAYGLLGKKWDVTLSHIEGMRYDSTQGNFPFGKAVVIFDRQQRQLSVPRSIADVKGLAARLTEAHSAAVLPDVYLRLEAGDDIRFGDAVSVNREMIVAPDPATGQPTQFGLRDFQQAFIKDHALQMSMMGKQLSLKIKDVLNAHYLMQVIMKAKALGPKVEIVIPIAHEALEKTEAMDKIQVTGENKPVAEG